LKARETSKGERRKKRRESGTKAGSKRREGGRNLGFKAVAYNEKEQSKRARSERRLNAITLMGRSGLGRIWCNDIAAGRVCLAVLAAKNWERREEKEEIERWVRLFASPLHRGLNIA